MHTWTEMKNISHHPGGHNEKKVSDILHSDGICIGWLKFEGMTFA